MIIIFRNGYIVNNCGKHTSLCCAFCDIYYSSEFKMEVIPWLTWVLWWIYAGVFIFIFIAASAHHYFGLRQRYLEFLIHLFAFGQERVEKKRSSRNGEVLDELESPSEETFNGPNLILPDHPRALGIKEDLHGFNLADILEYITAGVASVTEDSFTKAFESEEPTHWNLLSRNNTHAYEFVSFRLTCCWILGTIIRYMLLLPVRLTILIFGLVLLCLSMILVGVFPNGRLKRWLYKKLSVFCFDFIAGSLSLVATFHNPENAPKNGIAVANHTSPIDSMVLATDNCYDFVGQKSSGFLGVCMRALSRASYHIWFQRAEAKQRQLVVKRMSEHASNLDLPPILIYPEGVCVNNTTVMQFKKGAFEISSVIYPVAIKFDPRFGDAFWWQDEFTHYLVYMMTSWAIVCDVWYLPPMTRQPEESAIDFSSRVKSAIAHQGGMVDVPWDGFLKAKPVKEEWRKQQQLEFSKHLQGENISEEDGGSDVETSEEEKNANIKDIEFIKVDAEDKKDN